MRFKVPIVVKPSTAHYPKQHLLVKKKRRKNPKVKAHLHQRKKVFPISIIETVLNWVTITIRTKLSERGVGR